MIGLRARVGRGRRVTAARRHIIAPGVSARFARLAIRFAALASLE